MAGNRRKLARPEGTLEVLQETSTLELSVSAQKKLRKSREEETSCPERVLSRNSVSSLFS